MLWVVAYALLSIISHVLCFSLGLVLMLASAAAGRCNATAGHGGGAAGISDPYQAS